MTRDDWIYALILVASIIGAIVCASLRPNVRRFAMSALGAAFVASVSGWALLHSLAVTLLAITLICARVTRFHTIVFIITFAYLAFFRTCHRLGLGLSQPPSYANAVQLVLTLKLVGAAFEIKDSLERERRLKILLDLGENAKSEDIENLRREIKYLNVKANPVDLFTYSYCFVGLLTGPYFKYRVYLDCLTYNPTRFSNRYDQLISRLKIAAIIGVGYLIASHFYYIEYAKTDEFFNRHFLYRLCFMSIMFFVFRMRMYFAWLISECVCMCAGVGAYPSVSSPVPGQGPTNLKAMEQNDKSALNEVSFETTRNLNIAGCEWAPTVREGMRSWNMSVQYWLATFVYRRFPVKKFRTPVTMLVSAFWHGVHPGYYLSFMTIPLSLQAESALENLLYKNTPAKLKDEDLTPKLLLDKSFFIRWFYKMRVFDYCCMGFLLLEASATLRYWWSIWFSVHVGMVVLISLNIVSSPRHHAS